MHEIGTFCRADRLRLATLFQATEDTRYYLNGVYIDPMEEGVRLVATDGHRLAVFRDEAAFTCAPCIVSLPKAARTAIKSVKGREFVWFGIIGQHDGTGRHEARIVDGTEGMDSMKEIQAAMLDMTNPAVIWAGAVELIDGTYPEFEQAIPAYVGDAGAPGTFQSRYLAPFVEVAQDCAGKRGPISLHSDNPSGPALVQCGRKDFVGVLMPMRADFGALERDGALLRPPVWARARGQRAPEAEAA
jgi:DNA polymerase-3 subunit beta